MSQKTDTPGRAATAEATPQDRRAGKLAVFIIAAAAATAFFVYLGIIIYGLMVGS